PWGVRYHSSTALEPRFQTSFHDSSHHGFQRSSHPQGSTGMMRRAKISVIGSGNIGGECARSIAMKELG
ncbi:hypothetical protein, partial [Klebsiella pneumoniae]|uniref:hypothetical protein n=1 Tax=Klebsiella pneumoniae TaxID=573 RepID=UPI0025A17EDB